VITDNRPAPISVAQPHSRGNWLQRLALPSLGLVASERVLLLGLVDFALLAVALIIAVDARTPLLDAPGAIRANWRWFATLGVLWWIVAQLAEAYDLARAASAPHSILTTATAAAVAAVLYQMIPVITPPLTSRKVGLIFVVLSVGLIALWRGLYAVLLVQPAFERRLLVFGAGRAGRALAEVLSLTANAPTPNPYRGSGAVIVGFVDDAAVKGVLQTVAGAPVRGTSADLVRLARELRVDEVVLAISHSNTLSQAALDALVACREQGFCVTTMPAFYERALGRVAVEHVGRNMNAVFPVDERGFAGRFYPIVKRGVDLFAGTVGLLPLALTIPVVGLANLLTSPGPLFYRQVRLGKGGRPFEVIKYRTMQPNAEGATGPVWAGKDDSRVTPVGRWLRKSRLDELPQVLNMLRGEMSLVGPRPERPEFIDRLAEQIPFYRARHAVQPGITGWAQVRFGYGSTVEDARIKLEYDLYYVRHMGFYLDALIVLKTVGVVLKLQG
jgi:exopolysaccharide biosynthesis polyprenyl glycosylphosphotransferase